MHKLLLAAALIFGFSAYASAHEAEPAHYHAGKTQLFQGLVCKNRESAIHIYNAWMADGITAAKTVFRDYMLASECNKLFGKLAYFHERLMSSIALGFNGEQLNVLVFRISPVRQGLPVVDMMDFLVTWEAVRD